MFKDNLLYIQSNVEVTISLIKTIFIMFCIYWTNFKLTNKTIKINIIFVLKILILGISVVLSESLKNDTNYLISTVFLIFMISFIYNTENVRYSLITTIISFSLNYAILIVSIVANFIFNMITNLNNDIINLIFIVCVNIILLYKISNIKRLTYGLSFLKENTQENFGNDYIDVISLNISVVILFVVAILPYANLKIAESLLVSLAIFTIIMFINISKSIRLYYKQKLLIKDFEETKKELEDKTKEVEKLEQDILSYSKRTHSLMHKQKSLEYKLNQLMLNSEIAEELDIKDRLKNISNELYNKVVETHLEETGITEIDDMLKVMEAECTKYEIDFNVKIIGNIYYMVNNLVSKQELEILIADHVKNAIIAIRHSDNVNKSILVKLGKIDEYYGLYIYDSGVEFKKEVLDDLGKKQHTTYSDEGGTGMGFMNTFDTLNKNKASLIIEEIGKPCKENFTKVLMIKFDGKNEYKIISYRK